MINQENKFGFDCLLFEKCNLNCTFCLEEHQNNKIDYNWIYNMPDLLLNRFIEEKLENIKEITFRLWGGELFYDALPDSLFEDYRQLVDNIDKKFKERFPDIKLGYSWVSNGVYNNVERVIKLLKDTNSKINISYDPVGRYKSKEQEQLMVKNAQTFNDENLLDEISITLTKPNIEAYINNKSIIKELQFCKQFDINYYIPNINWKIMMPTDDDIFNFFKWVVDNNLFTILDVSRLIKTILYPTSKTENVCNCDKHLSACKNCITYNCVTSSTIYPNSDFYGDREINESNVSRIKKQLGLFKRGCMFCKYATICPKGCHTSILFKHYKPTKCPYQRLYEYIEENDSILNNYKQFASNK